MLLLGRQTFAKLLLSAVAFIASLIFAELVARLYVFVSPPPLSIWEFRRTQPPPYQGASYFSEQFLQESQFQPGKWITPENTTLVLPDNFSGRWFNIRDHRRVTAHQPASVDRVIYLFGGSTIYDSEVPDEYTVASQLQAVVAGRYIVENIGVTTVNARQELERLKTLALRPNDVVVFYDGVNDIIQGVTYRNPRGWIVGENRTHLAQMTWIERSLFRINQKYSNRVAMIRLALHKSAYPTLRYLYNAQELRELVSNTALQFETVIAEASRHSQMHGASFHHFLQPNIFTLSKLSDYERALLGNYYLAYPGLDVAFGAGYPALREVSDRLQRAGIRSHDMSAAFDDAARNGERLYLDYTHTAHRGNQIIAETMWSILSKEIP